MSPLLNLLQSLLLKIWSILLSILFRDSFSPVNCFLLNVVLVFYDWRVADRNVFLLRPAFPHCMTDTLPRES